MKCMASFEEIFWLFITNAAAEKNIVIISIISQVSIKQKSPSYLKQFPSCHFQICSEQQPFLLDWVQSQCCPLFWSSCSQEYPQNLHRRILHSFTVKTIVQEQQLKILNICLICCKLWMETSGNLSWESVTRSVHPRFTSSVTCDSLLGHSHPPTVLHL